MIKIYLTALTLLAISYSQAQKNVFLTISPKVAGADLQMGTDLTDLAGVVFNLNHFDYYVSNVHIIHDGGQDIHLTDTVFLVEPDKHILHLGMQNVSTIEQIIFSIGVPANLNTESGADAVDISTYPEGHPLSFQDPAMFWGWTAGYMHMIIGGPVDTDNDGITNAGFQLHNLGNTNYFTVTLPVVQTNTTTDQVDVYLNCHVDVWLKNIDIKTVGILHGSTGANRDVLRNVELETVFDQSGTASVATIHSSVGKVYFSNANEIVTVTWENVKEAQSFKVTDISGKLVNQGSVDGLNGSVILENITNGMYQFQLFDANANKLNSVKIAK